MITRHLDKTFRISFTSMQDRACTLRRRLAAGLSAADGIAELIGILYGDDFTASTVAATTLGDHGSEQAILPLVETVLWTDPEQMYFSRQLRSAAIVALGKLDVPDDLATIVAHTLLAATRDRDPVIVRDALDGLVDMRSAGATDTTIAISSLRACLAHEDAAVKASARRAMSALLAA